MRSTRHLPFLLLACAAAGAQAQASPSRGQLLYSTHCLECHTTQMHWRDGHKAHDWDSLRKWVRHWQAESRLQWNEEDVEAVTRHLNDTIYHFGRLAGDGTQAGDGRLAAERRDTPAPSR